MKQKLLDFFKKRNIELSLNTKARGHLGFYCGNKIVISKKLPEDKLATVLLHEFAHKIHSEIDKEHFKTGGTIEKLFNTSDTNGYEKELLNVTNFIDENSKCLKLEEIKAEFKEKVDFYEKNIKQNYPEFRKSKKFTAYEKYIKKTHCKSRYFLKYDNVKICTPLFFKNEFYSIDNIDVDFNNLSKDFKDYLKLLSNYRKQKKVQAKIAKMKRYYARPTELFARFVEGIATNPDMVAKLAPNVLKQFKTLLKSGYYNDLGYLIDIVRNRPCGLEK